MDCPPKKVAVMERWPSVEVRLWQLFILQKINRLFSKIFYHCLVDELDLSSLTLASFKLVIFNY